MKRFFRVFLAVLAAAAVLSLASGASSIMKGSDSDGYVVYRQSFADVSSPEAAGVRRGTYGETGFDMSVADGALRLENLDDLRYYVLFPSIELLDTYTVEYTFRFTDYESSNGYLGFMLTCTGDEPTNVTSAVIRVDGKCGDFGTMSDRIKKSLAGGEKITVTIPVEERTLHQITVSAGGVEKTLILENVVDIVNGGFGFVARNASVEIFELSITRGVEYDTKLGPLVSLSSRTDDRPYSEAESVEEAEAEEGLAVSAPETADTAPCVILTAAALSAVAWARKGKRRSI